MLPLGIAITLILFIMPGYLLSIFSSFRSSSIIERVYFGFVLSLAITVLVGLILSFFKIFTPFWIWVFLVIYNIISIILYLRYSKIIYKSVGERCKINTKIIFLFIVTFIICFAYTQLSPFPIGWDRGKHFGRSIFTLKLGMLETTHPGTNCGAFYFQGSNIVLSLFTGATYLLLNLNPTIKISNFSSLVELSITFKFFYTLLVSLTGLSIYCVSVSNYKNEKIGMLSILVFISVLGFNIASEASIGTILALIFLGILYIYLNFLGRRNLNHVDSLSISIITISIMFTHIIGGAFMIVSIVLALCWKYSKREITSKQLQKMVVLMIISICLSVLFLSVSYPSLFHGILDEADRNTHISQISGSFGMTLEKYFSQNIERIFYTGGAVTLISLALLTIGFLLDLKREASLIIPLTFTSLLFTFIPILPFVKPQIHLMYPLSILGGLGLFHIPKIVKGKKRIGRTIRIIICAYLVIATTLSTKNVLEAGLSRQQTYGYDTYKEIYDLSVWLDKEFDSNPVILFPYAGAHAYLLNALSSYKMFFAEPRFSDLPSYQETSKIYQEYPTTMGLFDYSNVSSEERYIILNKYNISVIVEVKLVKVDIESLKLYYSGLEVHHPTPSYWVVILEERVNENTAG